MSMPATLILVSMVAFFVLVPSKVAISEVPGATSPLQLAAVDQLLSAPPPSQVTTASTATCQARGSDQRIEEVSLSAAEIASLCSSSIEIASPCDSVSGFAMTSVSVNWLSSVSLGELRVSGTFWLEYLTPSWYNESVVGSSGETSGVVVWMSGVRFPPGPRLLYSTLLSKLDTQSAPAILGSQATTPGTRWRLSPITAFCAVFWCNELASLYC